jgi:hypothetical protein
MYVTFINNYLLFLELVILIFVCMLQNTLKHGAYFIYQQV